MNTDVTDHHFNNLVKHHTFADFILGLLAAAAVTLVLVADDLVCVASVSGLSSTTRPANSFLR